MDLKLQKNGRPESRGFSRSDWLLAAALSAVVFLVYQRAWRGGFLWDDNAHITRPALQSWQGLGRIWFDPRATQQYYPLTHTVFWIEHKLWGDATLGYHLVNLCLHVTAALLVVVVLRRLAVPGAWLAAGIFALHPVHVESVAWISELKNTLSAVLYLGAMLAYLRFDRTRERAIYCLALGLFLLALLTKTVTCTLPAALLVIFWWQRGGLSWKKDVLPLAPLFVLGAVGGLFTSWVERALLHAEGSEYQFAFVERLLIAGRVAWFYLAKLFWPVDLIFIYPRWPISRAVWWQYLFPLAAVGLLAALWLVRRRSRAPLAALLFFGGTLFPALGFFNVFPFRYSFVADHFQYLASLGPIVLTAAAAATLFARRSWGAPVGYGLSVALLATLGYLSWRQSRIYSDAETLYRATIASNPDCWMAYNNLGVVLTEAKEYDKAMKSFRKSLEINSDHAEAHNNYGTALERAGKPKEALAQYRLALDIESDYLLAYPNLARVLLLGGRTDEAIECFQKAVALAPGNAGLRVDLALALTKRGRLDEAEATYGEALQLAPQSATAHGNLGNLLVQEGRLDEAAAHLQQAAQIAPEYAEARNDLGAVLGQQGKVSAAIAEYQQALKIRPNYADARHNLESALSRQRAMLAEFARRRAAVRAHPDDAGLLNDLAWDLATNPDDSVRNGAEAVELARRAVQLSGGREPASLAALAAAYAEAGRFDEAVQAAGKARGLFEQQIRPAQAAFVSAQLRLYAAHSPYRQMPLTVPRLAPLP